MCRRLYPKAVPLSMPVTQAKQGDWLGKS